MTDKCPPDCRYLKAYGHKYLCENKDDKGTRTHPMMQGSFLITMWQDELYVACPLVNHEIMIGVVSDAAGDSP